MTKKETIIDLLVTLGVICLLPFTLLIWMKNKIVKFSRITWLEHREIHNS